MSTRTTQADIFAAFAATFGDRCASDIGGPGSTYDNRHNIGKLGLDYNPVYGGWVVFEYVAGSGGMGSAHNSPYGHTRRAGRAMLEWLQRVRWGEPSYRIVRMFSDDRAPRRGKGGLTLAQAQAHCQREDTHGGDFDKGTAWFDGYEEE